jgi:hypothetical protein
MTGTQHVGTLKHQFLQYITIKWCLLFFIYQNNILVFCTCYLVATSTGSKLQLLPRWREWENFFFCQKTKIMYMTAMASPLGT